MSKVLCFRNRIDRTVNLIKILIYFLCLTVDFKGGDDLRQRQSIFILDVEVTFTPKGEAYVVGLDQYVKKYGYHHIRQVLSLVKAHNLNQF